MTAKTYNGWSSYETWCVKLWMDNESGTYDYWTATAQECYDEADADYVCTRTERAAINLADRLKSEHEDAQPDLGSTVWADMLNASMSEVNWDEIARNMLEAIDQDEEADDESEAE